MQAKRAQRGGLSTGAVPLKLFAEQYEAGLHLRFLVITSLFATHIQTHTHAVCVSVCVWQRDL